MRFNLPRRALPALLALPWLAVGCTTPERLPAPNISVSAADVAEANTAKPEPGPETLTSDKANAVYNAEVETWGETVQRAWGRICRSIAGQQVTVVGGDPLPCPKAP